MHEVRAFPLRDNTVQLLDVRGNVLERLTEIPRVQGLFGGFIRAF